MDRPGASEEIFKAPWTLAYLEPSGDRPGQCLVRAPRLGSGPGGTTRAGRAHANLCAGRCSGTALGPFLVTTALGTLLWTGLLAAAGYVLAERYRDVAGWIEPAGNAVVILARGGYSYRVLTFGKPTREVP